MSTEYVAKVELEEGQESRIDKYISDVLQILTRSQLKNRLEEIYVNNKKVKPSRKVLNGDTIKVIYAPPEELSMDAQEMNLDIIYENNNVVVVNKPQGMVVHPGNGNHTDTLVQGLLYHCDQLKGNFEETEDVEDFRPGIVHRLDKDTSGVIITAKTPEAHGILAKQFFDKLVKKTYVAIVKGELYPFEGKIETLIGRDPFNRKKFSCDVEHGKDAVTFYRVLKTWNNYSLVHLYPKTGRTHQLRAHMLHVNCPILGDPIYSRKDKNFPDATLMLHAYKLKLKLPGEVKHSVFKSLLPPRFVDILRILNTEE